MLIHVLFVKDKPVGVSVNPFTLPEYGDKTSITQVVYAPVPTVEQALRADINNAVGQIEASR